MAHVIRGALLLVVATACVAASSPAQAAELRYDVASAVSSNWAGYAVSAADAASPVSFSSVSGAWKQPVATCTAGSPSYSAFWVGLGGFADDSQALEQIGTESNCSADGTATYGVWYELVPAASVPVKLVVRPGDTFAANVAVSGQTVTLSIKNVTRKKSFTKKLTMSAPDASSAEWIAEAPSACTSYGDCRALPLANFGTVTFASARATAAGHTGAITDGAWSATAVSLTGGSFGGFPGRRFAAMATAGDATPSALSSTGGSFSVSWSEARDEAPADPGAYAP
jgi:Peptidase A4 family